MYCMFPCYCPVPNVEKQQKCAEMEWKCKYHFKCKQPVQIVAETMQSDSIWEMPCWSVRSAKVNMPSKVLNAVCKTVLIVLSFRLPRGWDATLPTVFAKFLVLFCELTFETVGSCRGSSGSHFEILSVVKAHFCKFLQPVCQTHPRGGYHPLKLFHYYYSGSGRILEAGIVLF